MSFTIKAVLGLGSAGAVLGGLLGAVGGPPGIAVGASMGAMIGGAVGGAAARVSNRDASVDTQEPESSASDGDNTTATTSSHDVDLSAVPKTGPALGLREGRARRDVAMARKHRPSPQRKSRVYNASEAAAKVDTHSVESQLPFIQQPLNAEPATPMRSTAEAGTGAATTTLPPAESASAEGSPEVSKRKYHLVGAVPGLDVLAQVSPQGIQVNLFKDHLKKTPVSDRTSTPEVPEWVTIAQKRASERGAEGRAAGTDDEPEAKKDFTERVRPQPCHTTAMRQARFRTACTDDVQSTDLSHKD